MKQSILLMFTLLVFTTSYSQALKPDSVKRKYTRGVASGGCDLVNYEIYSDLGYEYVFFTKQVNVAKLKRELSELGSFISYNTASKCMVFKLKPDVPRRGLQGFLYSILCKEPKRI